MNQAEFDKNYKEYCDLDKKTLKNLSFYEFMMLEKADMLEKNIQKRLDMIEKMVNELWVSRK